MNPIPAADAIPPAPPIGAARLRPGTVRPARVPFAARAWMLALAWPVPHLALAWLDWRHWMLVRGDANAQQSGTWPAMIALLIVSAVAGVIVAVRRRRQESALSLPMAAGALVLSAIALAAMIMHGTALIPDSFQGWMLPPQRVIFEHFSLLMPLALLAGFVAVESTTANRVVWFAVPFVAFGAAAAIAWVGFRFAFRFNLPVPLAVAGFIGFAVLSCGGLLSLVLGIYSRCRASSPRALAAFSFLIAVCAPVAGLLLNRVMPFPYSFQTVPIYALAVVNGVWLTLPFFGRPVLARTLWLAQCALFPFTLYFFLVFVAFLPLTPLALLVFGGGLLMLAPLALFGLHLGRIADGFRLEWRGGNRLAIGALGVAALVAWPVAGIGLALADRARIHTALDYLFHPDLRADGQRPPDSGATARVLVELARFKSGIWLPYLSDAYGALVFDGLVLPAARIEKLHRFFTGTDLPASKPLDSLIPVGPVGRSPSVEEAETVRLVPPDSGARLASVTAADSTHGAIQTRVVRVDVSNPSGGGPTEYRGTFDVPPSAAVTGFWLHIGDQRVPGQLFEKKAALWVYQRITSSPEIRDPAILRYTGPNRLELQVFPVPAGGNRTVEVEFTAPAGALSELRLDGGTVAADPAPAAAALTDSGAVRIPSELGPSPHARQPYLQIVVDCSRGSPFRDAGVLERAVAAAVAANPDCGRFRLMAAGVTCVDVTREARPVVEAVSAVRETLSVAERNPGGFDLSLALRTVFWRRHHEALEAARAGAMDGLLAAPRIVVFSETTGLDVSDLDPFRSLFPDVAQISIRRGSGEVTAVELAGDAARGVRLARRGGAYAVLAEPGGFGFLRGEPAQGSLEVWDARGKSWRTIPGVQPVAEDMPYGAAMSALRFDLDRRLEPWRSRDSLDRAVARSQEAGTLTPSSAYVVMESHAQWELVKRAEAKARGAHESLQMAATPEPGTVMLLGAGAVWLACLRRRRA
jgi:hypothetical protein